MIKKNRLSLAVAAAVFAAPTTVLATNGYFAHGYSIKEKGLAGAGAALAQDSLAAATNPAGMALIGSRVDVGISAFSPIREYTSTGGPSAACVGASCTFSVGPQSIESDNELFLIPAFGYNTMLDANSSVGVSVYGNGGMNTEYQGGTATYFNPSTGTFVTTPGTYGAGTAGVDLSQLFVAPTYARKIAPNAAVGVSAILAYQRFKAEGLSTFAGFSTDPNSLSNNGYDNSFGYGAKVGVTGEVMPGLSLGASYQTRIWMEEFDKYKGLFAENGDFDIPPTASIGLAFKPTSASVLTFDVQRIWYSDVDSVANPLSNINTCTPGATGGTGAGCLGGANGAGFGWEDMTVYKLGYQFQTGADWTWRVGYSKTDQPIPSSEVLFNILAPAVIEEHYTFGFTKEMGKNNELTFAAMYAPANEVRGPNAFDQAQTIELKMYQYELALAYAWKF